jgi:hypothetical protein
MVSMAEDEQGNLGFYLDGVVEQRVLVFFAMPHVQ